MDQQTGTFTLSLPDTQGGQDALGLWEVNPQLSDKFPFLETDELIGSIWHVELPEDPLEATRYLGFHQYLVEQTHKAIPAAGQRLPADLEVIRKHGEQNSFSAGSTRQELNPASPGGILQSAVQYRWSDTSSSYFLDQFKLNAGQLEEVVQSVTQFSDQVKRTIQQLALVETAIGGNLIGVTRVAWSGDADTWWAAGIGSERFNQHGQVLSQALSTRQDWLHFLLIVTSGAGRVAAALATGPFSPIAIWTTWNYALQVVAEFRSLPIQAARMTNS